MNNISIAYTEFQIRNQTTMDRNEIVCLIQLVEDMKSKFDNFRDHDAELSLKLKFWAKHIYLSKSKHFKNVEVRKILPYSIMNHKETAKVLKWFNKFIEEARKHHTQNKPFMKGELFYL